MTSESDNTPRRRAPTIDLTATEVEPEKPASAQEAETASADGYEPDKNAAGKSAPPGGRLRLRFAHAIGAFTGALIVIVIFVGLWRAGFVPSPGGSPSAAVTSETPASKDFSARLDRLEAAVAAQHPDTGLAPRMAAAEAQTKALDNSLTALNRRLDGIAVTVGHAQARADAAVAAAEAAKNAAQSGARPSDLEALANRTAALERGVKALSEDVQHRAASADDRIARRTVVAEALRAAVERGVPYEAELAALKSLGVDQAALAPLQPFAAHGVPSVAALASELAALRPALPPDAAAAPHQDSFLDRLRTNAEKLVRVTAVDASPGTDARALMTRINAEAARGDIAAALTDMGRLPEAEHALAEPWMKKAAAREAAVAASQRIAADALAALTRPVSQ